MSNRTKRTPKKVETFFGVLRAGGSVSKAASAAGVGRTAVYQWRRSDPEFKAAWDDAVETGTDALEDEAFRRAFEGVEEPVFYQGDVVGHVRRYSDTMLIVMLKARRPEKYKEHRHVSGSMTVNLEGEKNELERRLNSVARNLGRDAVRQGAE